MRELKNFKSSKRSTEEKEAKAYEATQNFKEDDVKRMIDERSSKSESELMEELKQEVSKNKKEGKFTEQEVQNFKQTVTPFLNDEQKSKLDEIIKMIT